MRGNEIADQELHRTPNVKTHFKPGNFQRARVSPAFSTFIC